ncbi:MAG: hypothetical protein E6J72_04080 [Deltaproteobacteria bacterium]|nr:MAG: hypothetical protein E6J72_04080 [Deltaproteobacteria bacterium]
MKVTLATAVLLALLSAHCAREAEEPRSTSRPAASPAEPAASRGEPPASRGGSAAHDHTAGEESAHGGAPERVTLSHDAVASAGIETVAVAHVTTPIDAFGRVLDPMPVVDALHARAAARSAAATARAEHARVVRLRADQQNASTRDVESARAARDRADAELATTTARVALAWGATIAAATPEDAFCDDLVAGRTAVARIDFAAGDHVEQMPATVTVSAAGRPDRQFAARVLGPAPTTDPTLQGDAFFVLIGAEPPPAGTALRATIVRAAALDGVAVPRAAIVWSAGKPAVYVERDAGTFERRSLALAAALPGAWLVTDGVAAGERVVTTGAGQLLSAQTLTPKAE